MKIKNVEISASKLFCLVLYYGFAQWLPPSQFPLGGKYVRYILVKHIFKRCGKNVNIERRANFGSGRNIEIGDNSGIGLHAHIPSNTKIGHHVMMGPNCYILAQNHRFDRTDIPMGDQGFSPAERTVIGNDVWIGRDVLMTPGRKIADGSIIAGGCVLCKDFPEYSVIGGNPSKVIKSRIKDL